MDRRSFVGKLTAALGLAAVAPSVLPASSSLRSGFKEHPAKASGVLTWDDRRAILKDGLVTEWQQHDGTGWLPL